MVQDCPTHTQSIHMRNEKLKLFLRSKKQDLEIFPSKNSINIHKLHPPNIKTKNIIKTIKMPYNHTLIDLFSILNVIKILLQRTSMPDVKKFNLSLMFFPLNCLPILEKAWKAKIKCFLHHSWNSLLCSFLNSLMHNLLLFSSF